MHQLWTGNSSSVWHEFVNLFFLKGVVCGRSKQVGCSTNFGKRVLTEVLQCGVYWFF